MLFLVSNNDSFGGISLIRDTEIENTTVNMATGELQAQFMEIKELTSYIPDNIKIIPMEGDLNSEIRYARIGHELWRYLLFAVIILTLTEMILSKGKKQH